MQEFLHLAFQLLKFLNIFVPAQYPFFYEHPDKRKKFGVFFNMLLLLHLFIFYLLLLLEGDLVDDFRAGPGHP